MRAALAILLAFGARLSIGCGDGNIVIAGFFSGSVDFGGGTLNSAGGEDIFAAKFSLR